MQSVVGVLSRIEFEVLSSLCEDFEDFSVKAFCSRSGADELVVSALISEFENRGWIDDKGATALGLEMLEPYRVKRAIIMAAGFGSRLVPITLNTPKPLVRVNGTRIIDTLLDAVVGAGIEEIIIVRGYLGEQFDQLSYKYSNIKYVDNPLYDKANNISSIVAVRELLQNAYVMEADLYLKNPKLIKKYHYSSCFLGIPVTSSEDWCFVVSDGLIKAQVPNGAECVSSLANGERLYQEVGISYWDSDDGYKLAKHIVDIFEKNEGKNRYWDQVVFLDYATHYSVEIRPCELTDVVEIDSYRELVEIDPRYLV